jgi:uncharacterized protein with FMN-binding domain
MRRPTAAVVGTIAGTALLVGARLGTPPAGDPAGQLAEDPAGAPDQATPTTTGSAARHPGAVPPSGTGRPTAPAPTRTTASPKRTATATAARTRSSAPTSTGLRAGTYPGSTVTHKYGTLRVTITVAGGRISAITESYATSLKVSEQINQDALPKLRQEALAAQSARIDTVSGATYTSGAYRTSLQAAIDRAGG